MRLICNKHEGNNIKFKLFSKTKNKRKHASMCAETARKTFKVFIRFEVSNYVFVCSLFLVPHGTSKRNQDTKYHPLLSA